MKKVATFLFSIATFFCSAQVPIGLKAGINLNSILIQNATPDFSYKATPSIGFHIGVFTSLKLSDKVALTPELQYIVKGYKNEDSAAMETYNIKLSYLEMPIMFSYRIIKNLDIEVGPSLGIKVSAKLVNDEGDRNKLSDDFAETVDLGLQGGIRFNASEKISVIGRYNYGLSSFAKYTMTTPTGASDGTVEFHNSTIQFSVTYKIN